MVVVQKFLITIGLCFFLKGLQAQASGSEISSQYRVVHWGVENGLSQGINQKIIKDNNGFLWATSYEGINRFDGRTFRNYFSSSKKRNAIKGIEVAGVVQDFSGKIWFGSGYGLNCYNPVTDSVSYFFTELTGQKESRYIIPIAPWKDEIICFTINNELIAYNAITFKSRVVTKNIQWSDNYSNAANGSIDTTKGNLYLPAAKGLIKVNLTTGLQQEYLASHKCNAILFDKEINTFIVGTDEGLLLWNGADKSAVKFSGAVPAEKITCIGKAKDGAWWVGTEEYGLYAVSSKRDIIHLFKSDHLKGSINGNKINSVYCDDNGAVWIGVGTNGIDQLIPYDRFRHHFHTPRLKNGLSGNIVRSFAEDSKRNIWIATEDGINIFNPEKQAFSKFHSPQFQITFPRYLYNDPTGDLWIAAEKGLYRTNTANDKTIQIKFTDGNGRQLTQPYTEQIIPFVNNTLLIGTKQYGLFSISKNDSTAHQLPYPGNKHVFFISFSNNFLFISQWNDKLALFRIEKGEWHPVQTGISDFTITHVLFDSVQKKYFIGTIQGLVEADEALNILYHYTINEGLPNNYIYAMVADEKNNIWISTNKGLSVFNTSTKTFKNYTPADGLQEYEYNAKAAYRTKNGSVYFGGINGFDVISPLAYDADKHTAKLYIKNLLINNIEYSGTREINYTNEIHLSYQQNNITIQTGIIDFMPKGNNRVKYMLRGIDRDWRIADRDFMINYSGLLPGEYEFIATTTDNSPARSVTQRLRIIINGPWWASGWLRSIFVVLIAGIVFLLFHSYYRRKLRAKQLQLEKEQAVEKERTRIAMDMHDDLGSGLSRIRFLSEKLKLKHHQEKQDADIDKIESYSKDMLNKMGEIVWALNEKNDTLGDLMAYTREYAAGYLAQHGVRCRISIPDVLPQNFVRGEFRRNVFLAVKEALHNIIKHAGASEVHLRMIVGRTFRVEIADDGKGFNSEHQQEKGNGLANMRKRIEVLNGHFSIKSESGTVIDMEIPLI